MFRFRRIFHFISELFITSTSTGFLTPRPFFTGRRGAGLLERDRERHAFLRAAAAGGRGEGQERVQIRARES